MKLNKTLLVTAAFVCLAINVFGQQPKITSVYTDLTDKKCKTLERNVEEGGYYRGLCQGTAGYKLELTEGDLRQSINVIAPNKKKFELDLWTNVSGAFSFVGDKAEWRVIAEKGKMTPVALIVRFNASENPDNPNQKTSYLVVSKINKNEVCITDVVKSVTDANARARELADVAGTKSCRTFKN